MTSVLQERALPHERFYRLVPAERVTASVAQDPSTPRRSTIGLPRSRSSVIGLAGECFGDGGVIEEWSSAGPGPLGRGRVLFLAEQ